MVIMVSKNIELNVSLTAFLNPLCQKRTRSSFIVDGANNQLFGFSQRILPECRTEQWYDCMDIYTGFLSAVTANTIEYCCL